MPSGNASRIRSVLLVLFVIVLSAGRADAGEKDYGDLRGVNYVPSYARNDVAIWMDFVLEEDGMVFRGFWTRWTGTGPRQERLFYSRNSGDTVTFDFQGPTLTLIHKAGPDCGLVRVMVDGKPLVQALDTFSPNVDWNRRSVLVEGLNQAKHSVTLDVTGIKHDKSTDCYVQIVDFEAAH